MNQVFTRDGGLRIVGGRCIHKDFRGLLEVTHGLDGRCSQPGVLGGISAGRVV